MSVTIIASWGLCLPFLLKFDLTGVTSQINISKTKINSGIEPVQFASFLFILVRSTSVLMRIDPWIKHCKKGNVMWYVCESFNAGFNDACFTENKWKWVKSIWKQRMWSHGLVHAWTKIYEGGGVQKEAKSDELQPEIECMCKAKNYWVITFCFLFYSQSACFYFKPFSSL